MHKTTQIPAVIYSGIGDLVRILRRLTTALSKILSFYFIVPVSHCQVGLETRKEIYYNVIRLNVIYAGKKFLLFQSAAQWSRREKKPGDSYMKASGAPAAIKLYAVGGRRVRAVQHETGIKQ